ncbi:MAG: hypothetical protein ACRENP_23960, partial [Longimicrobiales bacterium]
MMTQRDIGHARSRAIGLATLVVGVAICSASQEVSAQQIPAQLTLEEAQRLARLHNPEFRQAENDAGPAAAAVRARYG